MAAHHNQTRASSSSGLKCHHGQRSNSGARLACPGARNREKFEERDRKGNLYYKRYYIAEFYGNSSEV
jgi:hypothetical protein